MIYCILAKILAVVTSVFLGAFKNIEPSLTMAFIVGIVPIWSEVVVSKLLRVEPSRESRLLMRLIDNLVDGITFLIVPSLWFSQYHRNDTELIVAILLFNIAGILRLVRFTRRGLQNGQFVGLPVTFTGYLWLTLVLINSRIYTFFALITLSWAMVSKRIKLDSPNYEAIKNK